ncbi:uncharacterized protein LOC125665215 isoform X3 [Ostrea edulis]|uniref:uncharacterized protein LOC125665215 isoform X3 n=1 Tax=Ostrea edulis TaxID=37623 RepID=UPI0024AEBCE0|nr:uncharacterized protein LOC125665215 isoform X3 [Ostrea edulis]
MSNSEDVPLPLENEAFKDDKREKELLAIRLQRAIREKKVSEAKNLLSEKPDIHYKDKVGSQCLHYAAQEGFLDIVKLLLEEGAHVNCFDHNGRSPLHNAASRGHLDVVIHLVANGAQVASLDWDNHTPFEKAVISRCVDVVEVLLTFGAEPNLQDWTWVMDMKEKEKKILEIITSHNPLVPGYRYEGIKFAVVQVKPNEDCPLTMLNLTVKAIDVRNPFILFCRKMQSEFTELKSLLREEEIPYSDMFEIRTWGVTRKTLTLSLIVEGVPNCNEHLKIVSPLGHIGRVDNFVKNDDENTTEVLITIKMNSKGPTQFAIASVFKKETFAISKEEVKIQPMSEPEAEIDIPKGTFATAGELQLNVMDTKDVNEDEEDESGPLLMTNVIDMSMSDGQQPKEEIVMKLPIHNKGDDKEAEMCVLATSEEDPDDPDDWEIIHAEKDSKGKAAVFKIKHFSIYAATKKMLAEKQRPKVVDAILQTRKGTRKVRFFVMTKWEHNTNFDVVIEISSQKKLAERQRHWESEGYEAPEISTVYEIRYGEVFQMCFEGTVQNDDAETYIQLEFLRKRNNNSIISRIISLENNAQNIALQINRGTTVTHHTEVVITEKTLGCWKSHRKKIESVERTEYSHFATMDVNARIPTPPTPEPNMIEVVIPEQTQPAETSSDPGTEEEEENEKFKKVAATMNTELTYSVLNPSSIQALCSSFTLEEAGLFAVQMGLPNTIHGELSEVENPVKELTFRLFQFWRGSKHSRARIRKIERGLQVIDRNDLAEVFSKAFKEDLPFPTYLSAVTNGTN